MSWVSGLQYTNKGPHGLSEILVACTTSMANNGQNFAGLSADTPFYSITPALAMRAGRFAQRRRKPITDGTLPTDTTVFVVGALSYLPVLAPGPIVEPLALRQRFPLRGPRTRPTSPLGRVAAPLRLAPAAH